jgi:SPP1 family predicted phage head-tail adaptor
MAKREVIGQLDRRITIQRKVIGSDVSNQHNVLDWENIPCNPVTWAYVNEKSGQEVFQADQLVGVTACDFIIRFRRDVDIEHRILYNSKVYNIQAILEIGRREFLRITCESGGQYTEG